MADDSPVLIAYDGSEAARAAVREAGALFAPCEALVLTVWEPALAEFMMMPNPSGVGGTMLPYDPELAREVERSNEEHAQAIAADGATLAQAAGLLARALAEQDVTSPAEAIVQAAEQQRARAIVIGSRGLRGLKARLLGSTSTEVLHKAAVPVVVVRHPDESS
ncbi:MAG TPA: universal stress protein [Solirubrobacteraceae bacterium]|nr:universal stress protein [Solirubrobacteraceae bacterium]